MRSTRDARLPGPPPDPHGLRAQDAARRPGDLPQGPRADPDAGRHLPGCPGARVRRRLRRAVDGDAAGRGRHRRLRAARGLRRPGPGQRRRRSSARRRWPATGSSCATATTASTRPTSTGSCSTCPSRGRSSPTPRRPCAPAASSLAYTPRISQAVQLREALDGPARSTCAETLEVLNRTWHVEGPGGAPRPPHGGPHRLPHPRPAARRLTPSSRPRSAWNLLDAARSSVLAVLAVVGGYRLGFVTRVLSWSGWRSGWSWRPACCRRCSSQLDSGGHRVACSPSPVSCSSGGSFLGQALGLVIGEPHPVPAADGGLGGTPTMRRAVSPGWSASWCSVWLLLPVLAPRPGLASPADPTSVVAKTIDRAFPDAPDAMQALRRLVGDDQFPQVFEALRPRPRHRAAPDRRRPHAADGRPGHAVDRQGEGMACGRIQDGSGFVPSVRTLVVTNAHVVAGEDSTQVDPRRRQHARRHRRGLRPRPRPRRARASPAWTARRCRWGTATVATVGGVFGHPGGAPLRIAPFTVGDQVRRDRTRHLRLGTGPNARCSSSPPQLRPGDSGCRAGRPQRGQVVGVAFAIARGSSRRGLRARCGRGAGRARTTPGTWPRRWPPGPACGLTLGRGTTPVEAEVVSTLRFRSRRGSELQRDDCEAFVRAPRPLRGRGSLDLDEDALAGALLGRLDDGVELAVGDVARPSAPPGSEKTFSPSLT